MEINRVGVDPETFPVPTTALSYAIVTITRESGYFSNYRFCKVYASSNFVFATAVIVNQSSKLYNDEDYHNLAKVTIFHLTFL